jgi:penicillin G amidase
MDAGLPTNVAIFLMAGIKTMASRLGSHPLLLRFALLVIAPLGVAGAVGVAHLRQSLPAVQGELKVQGLSDAVVIERDRQGVPHIRARSDHDAFFAMGYVHAQDRMWQLELQRRIAQGRLSEVFGKDSVDQDIWFRTLGLYRSAESAWWALSPEARASLTAYADGVNAWLAGQPVLPLEFTLLGIRPEPWTVRDSLAWIKVFALNLGGNHRQEMERLLASQVVAPDQLHTLFPDYPDDAPTTVASLSRQGGDGLARLVELERGIQSELKIGGKQVGSNAWAVSGRVSRDGRALLANDPHLGLQIPSLWYVVALEGDTLDAAGMGLVGLPVVIFGRNRSVAWGGTNLMADVQDIYLEQARPDDPRQYDAAGKWASFAERTEVIQVRQDFPAFLRSPLQPVRVKVRTSRHGPIVSDMFKVFDQPAALRWTALDEDDTSYEAFYRLNYARDWPSFQAALGFQVAPALNMLYADDAGNIGYLGAGRMPVRRRGDGTLPVPGWRNDHEWQGSIPFAQWPRSFNPPAGYIVSANNKPVGPDYPYFISRDWAGPSRADRITELLREGLSGGGLDVAAMQRVQADTLSRPAQRLLGRLLQHAPSNEQQRRAFGYLAAWQGDMRRDSQAAAIFNAWVRLLKEEVVADELKGYWNKDRESRYLHEVVADTGEESLYAMLVDPAAAWCDDKGTEERETCDDAIDASLNDALWELLKIRGDRSMESWAWGALHQTRYQHTPFSRVNVLRSFFERRIGNGGSPDSVNVASYSYRKSDGYTQDFGAGFRQVMALGGGPATHLYMNSTGQSGNLFSRHYDDMIEAFRDVGYHNLPDRGGSDGVSILRLAPAR